MNELEQRRLVDVVALALIGADGQTPHQRAKAALKAHEEWLESQWLEVVRKDSSGEMHRMVSQTYDGEIGWGDEG